MTIGEVQTCRVTPIRRKWLQHLAQHGETEHKQMPKRAHPNGGSATMATWMPLIEAGLITARYDHDSPVWGRFYSITDLGRQAILGRRRSL